MNIETEQLILRRYRPEDQQDLYEYLSDAETVRFEPYRPMDIPAVKEALAFNIQTAHTPLGYALSLSKNPCFC